jgi:hypothetical protein
MLSILHALRTQTEDREKVEDAEVVRLFVCGGMVVNI